MILTIEQLSKKTKLSVSTIRVYTPKLKLGKQVGNKRVYSEADVKKLMKESSKPSTKKSSKPSAKQAAKKASTKRATRKAVKPRPVAKEEDAPTSASRKSSFWDRIFGGNKKEKRVSLIDAKLTK